MGWGRRTDAVSWAKNGGMNHYSFDLAQRWFKNGFTLPQKSDRRKYQAKMLVAVGHLMHMMNDMNVPAHVRDDSHPLGDPLEVWMRGGDGTNDTGFYVRGSKVANERYAGNAPTRFDIFENGMKLEANYTAGHFFSKDTIFHKNYHPRKEELNIPELDPNHPGDYGYVTDANGRKLAVAYWSGWFGRVRKTLDYSVKSDVIHHEYGKVLIPRAIANAAGFLNYFFRGQMEVEANACGVKVTNVSDPSTVSGAGAVTFKSGGVLKVFYDDEAGNRKMIGKKTLEVDLPVQESVFVPVRFFKKEHDEMGDAKVWTVVYEGDIGSEKGVSVATAAIEDTAFEDIPKAVNGAVDMYLSWNYECDIDMDLSMQGPNAVFDIKDIPYYGKEHGYVPSLFDLRPGDHYDFGTTGEAIEGSTLDDETLENDPVFIKALLETPTGSYFKEWEVNSLANLDIGKFAELDIEDKIEPKWICPALNNVPGWYRLLNGDTGKFECIPCEEPYSVVWYKPNAKLPGYYRCDRPVTHNRTTYQESTRTYTQCSEEEKKSSCGCVPCEFIVSGMKKRVENGPIAGADVQIVRADAADESNPTVVYTTKTTDKEDIFESGMIELSDKAKAAIDIDAYYIVSAYGGKDIDYDDDMHRDIVPTVNHGTIHAIVKGDDLILMPFRVNILTEAIYQVSGDVIGDNYEKEALRRKLDDAAQRLLSQKLYIKDENKTVRYADVLLWTPAVDKKALYKPFETFVKPIIDRLYADMPRYKESYALIYDAYESDAPQLKPQSLTIPRGLPNGTAVAQVTTLNQKPFENIVLEGSYHEHFTVDNEGVIRVAQSALVREGNVYRLQMYAVGQDGKAGSKVSLGIDVEGSLELAHPQMSVPVFVSASVQTIEENSPAGTAVADISFRDENATIVGYTLSGEDADSFVIDESGHVSVAQDARIDYEKSRVYTFTVTAQNNVGNSSFPVKIEVPIRNVIDTPIFDQVIFEHIEENTPVGTVITTIRQDRAGMGEVEKFEILSPNIPFGIDKNGTIRITQPIDYEQKKSYNFYAIAVTPYGNSNKVEINIVVDDQEPEIGIPHIEEGVNLAVREDTAPGTKIGEIAIDEGANPIERVAWHGLGKEFFRIDKSGGIYLQESLDYETKTHYDLGARALNARGWSNEVSIGIDVTNAPDEPPVLKAAAFSVAENVPGGTAVGTVAVIGTGEGSITGFTLAGEGSEDFTIDANGTIRVAADDSIDFEEQQRYAFQTTAQSTAGESEPVVVRIFVQNMPETAPQVADTTVIAPKEVDVGETAGAVQIVNTGDTPVNSYELTGEGSESFELDTDGNILLKKRVDIPEGTTRIYLLQYRMGNEAGWSPYAELKIIFDHTAPIITLSGESVVYVAKNAPFVEPGYSAVDDIDGDITSKVETDNFIPTDVPTGTRFTIHYSVADSAGNEAVVTRTVEVTEGVSILSLKKTGQTRSYDANGNEVTDGSLKDDGYYRAGVDSNYTRDDATGIVTDHVTGLQWQDDAAPVQKPWLTQENCDKCVGRNGQTQDDNACYDTSGDTAATYCEELTLGGYSDWRLPTAKELDGIVDYGRSHPAVDPIFQHTESYYYWSSSTSTSYTGGAWQVGFYSGNRNSMYKASTAYVRCVRSGQ
ncbi:cadherin domain-containing protein [Hydrogenimonas sp.]